MSKIQSCVFPVTHCVSATIKSSETEKLLSAVFKATFQFLGLLSTKWRRWYHSIVNELVGSYFLIANIINTGDGILETFALGLQLMKCYRNVILMVLVSVWQRNLTFKVIHKKFML